jgi:hypothetical protein
MSLLDEVRAVKTKRVYPVSDEDIQVALAWLRGDVTNAQIARALGRSSTNGPYVFLNRAIAAAFDQGLLIESPKGGRNDKTESV